MMNWIAGWWLILAGFVSGAALREWLWVFGVSAMLMLSAFDGIGGKSGHSMWWELMLLPYPASADKRSP